jgi:hypothetical protein
VAGVATAAAGLAALVAWFVDRSLGSPGWAAPLGALVGVAAAVAPAALALHRLLQRADPSALVGGTLHPAPRLSRIAFDTAAGQVQHRQTGLRECEAALGGAVQPGRGRGRLGGIVVVEELGQRRHGAGITRVGGAQPVRARAGQVTGLGRGLALLEAGLGRRAGEQQHRQGQHQATGQAQHALPARPQARRGARGRVGRSAADGQWSAWHA